MRLKDLLKGYWEDDEDGTVSVATNTSLYIPTYMCRRLHALLLTRFRTVSDLSVGIEPERPSKNMSAC